MGLNKGLTLVEVTITMIISTVVLGGLLALMANMQGSQHAVGQLRYLEGVTQSLVSRVIKDASEAVGDKDNPGIFLVGKQGLPAQTFCIHKILAETTPPSVTDKWVCYTQTGFDIKVCDKMYIPDNVPLSLKGADGVCAAPPDLVNPAPAAYVASVPEGTLRSGATPADFNPSFFYDPVLQKSIFKLKIDNRVSPGKDVDAQTNPSYLAEENVAPAGCSLE